MQDRGIYPGSRIGALPRIFRPAAITLRNALDRFGTRSYPYQFDGVLTRHNAGFMSDPAFVAAYARSVKAAGQDFFIPWRVHQALWCAASAPPGAFVELGTGRGFVMSAVMSQHPARELHLFDTFDPHYIAPDGTQTGREIGYYAASFEAVRDNFSEWPNVRLHRGDIFATLPEATPDSIAFLHIDLNHAKVEAFSLRQCWPVVKLGGVLLLDDYAHAGHEAQFAAINTAAEELGISIMSTASGQGIAIKH